MRVTIVGLGPRGLGVLQRIGERAGDLPAGTELEIHLVDPGETGQGAHPARQPDYLLTNTLASQLSMFSRGQGPSFTEWAQQTGYRRFGSAYCRTADAGGAPIGERDYLPRSLLGEYLSFVFDSTARALPPSVRLLHHRCLGVDLEETAEGGVLLRTDDGVEIAGDFAFLATGHSRRVASNDDARFEAFVADQRHRNHRLDYIAAPYPIDRLRSVEPDSTVAVQGLGLTAHDVIAALTVGRGGRFEGEAGATRYLPSGREPRILLTSRQCLPAAARGVNQKGVSGGYQPSFFTPEAVAALRREARRRRGTPQLDFDQELLPLLLRELGYVWRSTLEQRHVPPREYEFGSEDRAAVEAVLDPLAGRTFGDLDEFTAFFTAFVADDLAQAEQGNRTSPVKAATDAIRDVRESLRQAVDFAGLTPRSHREFNERWVPLMNRTCFGPPRRRNYELLALFRAGVVGLAGGPGCRVGTDEEAGRFAIRTDFDRGSALRHADVLIAARLDLFHPGSDSSELTRRLLARGLVRPFANGDYRPGGLDITRSGRVVAKTGDPLQAVWALGYPVEGPRYYTYYVPRAGQSTRFAAEADAAVDDMWTQLTERTREESHDGRSR
ncbi:FAD/NAD(P)-binding protein [Streptacidiphilus sp. P02-A3a]|uniref:FAD/NAD(P)-binding protein n=1 Tax=Streptacidiphilus sp. P02-A3a TaxID=2704468 RepID=UPI0015FDAC60|nr:FAD/NAD(P)-binding protein [Streptacidiphilus sp. P02-A3a]QMU71603.1 FAD/NAD(P)-binding protein [Streptacidiphilus sp. P02-A3a]